MNDTVLTITTLKADPYPIYNINLSKNNQVNTVENPYFFVHKSSIYRNQCNRDNSSNHATLSWKESNLADPIYKQDCLINNYGM